MRKEWLTYDPSDLISYLNTKKWHICTWEIQNPKTNKYATHVEMDWKSREFLFQYQKNRTKMLSIRMISPKKSSPHMRWKSFNT